MHQTKYNVASALLLLLIITLIGRTIVKLPSDHIQNTSVCDHILYVITLGAHFFQRVRGKNDVEVFCIIVNPLPYHSTP